MMLWVTTIRVLRNSDCLLTKKSMDARRALTDELDYDKFLEQQKLNHQKNHFRTIHLKQRKILYNGVVSRERKICQRSLGRTFKLVRPKKNAAGKDRFPRK
ncbi:hypothetical protein E6H37_04705 [Candidatus Bathyarchaeota archaeon]|nr:MAG: hypothetical protein E6H37_04705 [Candidatus Bathyarchaeota archaeon]